MLGENYRRRNTVDTNDLVNPIPPNIRRLMDRDRRIAELEYPRKSVRDFAREMEDRLRDHDADRGEHGWDCESFTWLMDRVLDEIAELDDAIEEDDHKRVIEEATDAANFLMMIADNCKDRYLEHEKT